MNVAATDLATGRRSDVGPLWQADFRRLSEMLPYDRGLSFSLTVLRNEAAAIDKEASGCGFRMDAHSQLHWVMPSA